MGDPSDDLRKAVLAYAQQRNKEKVGRGDCWDLAHLALTEGAHAKTSADYGKVTATADYRWGKPVSVEGARPGDILQFKDHQAVLERNKKTRIALSDRSWLEYVETEQRKFSRGHHTAIVASSLSGGTLTVLEQHVQRGRGVVEDTVGEGIIYVKGGPPHVRSAKEHVQITQAWAQKVKAHSADPAFKALVDQAVKLFGGKPIVADVETTERISVTGAIHAYTPEPRE
jgi:hypothetical protein